MAQRSQRRFNGAATLSLRKLPSVIALNAPLSTLQWGRNFIVAEICPVNCLSDLRVCASMGPQLYRCGNESTPCPPCPVRVMLQWGRNFIVAEISRSAISCAVVVNMLQWGRNFIVAEMVPYLSLYGFQSLASMGPQLYRCGNFSLRKPSPALIQRFNGAATLSLRKYRRADHGAGGLPGFNGAATLSLRKCPTTC